MRHPALAVAASVLIAFVTVAPAGAQGIRTDGPLWHGAPAPRALPPEVDAKQFRALAPFGAPAGGQAFRLTKFIANRVPARTEWIELRLGPKGNGTIQASWSNGSVRLGAKDVAHYLADVENSSFSTAPLDASLQVVCVDGHQTVFEAVVADRYRYVYWDYCGVSSDIQAAFDELERLAGRKLVRTDDSHR